MSNDVPRPLVVDFPGWTENMIGHERDSMFYVVADEDEEGGFLLVTPKGMGDVGDGKVESKDFFMFLKRRVGAASTSQRPKDPSVMCVTPTGGSEISLSLVCPVLFLILLMVAPYFDFVCF